MSLLALKCENNAIFKQIYTRKLLIAFKMAYSCCLNLGGNLEFQEFLQNKFYNINYWSYCPDRIIRSVQKAPFTLSIETQDWTWCLANGRSLWCAPHKPLTYIYLPWGTTNSCRWELDCNRIKPPWSTVHQWETWNRIKIKNILNFVD